MADAQTWGLLPKAQDDPTTIDQEISAAIAAHNADPDAHTAAGAALDLHRVNEVIDHPAGSIVQDKFETAPLSFTGIKAFTSFETAARFQPITHGSGSAAFSSNGMTLATGATASSYAYTQNALLGTSMGAPFTFATSLYINGAVSGDGKAACGVGEIDVTGADILYDTDFVGFLLQKVGTTITIYGLLVDATDGTHALTAALATGGLGDSFDLIVRYTPGVGADFYVRKTTSGVPGSLQGPVTLTGPFPASDSVAQPVFAVTNQGTTKNYSIVWSNASFER